MLLLLLLLSGREELDGSDASVSREAESTARCGVGGEDKVEVVVLTTFDAQTVKEKEGSEGSEPGLCLDDGGSLHDVLPLWGLDGKETRGLCGGVVLFLARSADRLFLPHHIAHGAQQNRSLCRGVLRREGRK